MIVFWDETLCPNWLLTAVADKASLVPAVAFIFHLPCACNETRTQTEFLAETDAVCNSASVPDCQGKSSAAMRQRLAYVLKVWYQFKILDSKRFSLKEERCLLLILSVDTISSS